MKRWVLNLAVSSFLAFSIYLGFGLILPLLPLYTTELGGGAFEFGILFASFMLTRAFLASPFGRLSDRIGRKRIIVTGMFLYAILAFLFTIPRSWEGLILVRILQGTASAMVWPVGEALVIDSAPESKRSRSISVYMFLTNLGSVAGPLVGAGILFLSQDILHLGTLASLRLPFYFTSGISLIGAFVGLVFLRDALPSSNASISVEEEATPRDMPQKVKRSLYTLYAHFFMDGLAVAILGVVMFYFMNENFGLGARDFSILYGVSQAIALSVLVPTGVLTEKYRRKPFIFWGTLISRYLTIVLAFSMVFPYGYIIAFALFAVKDAGLYAASPALKSLLADITPARIRGHMLGTVQKYSGIGFVIGSLLSGLTWDLAHQRIFDIFGVPLHGDSLVLLASSLIGIFPLYLILRYVWEPKRGR